MKKTRNANRSFFLRFAVLLFALYAAWQIIELQSDISKLNDYSNELEAMVKEQRLANKDVKALLEQGDNPEYIERVAKEQLGFAYPDERVYVDISGS